MISGARLKPGVTLDQARSQMKSVAARIERDYPDSNKGWSVTVDRYQDRVVEDHLRRPLYVLLAAVVAVLLIGCANLANLLLARGAGRERLAPDPTGSYRSILLAGLGGGAGALIGFGLMTALKTWIPRYRLPSEADVRLDVRVLLFTAGVVILTGILFGIAPALHAAQN